MLKRLTEKQRQIFNIISNSISKKGIMPSMSTVAKRCGGVSKQCIHEHYKLMVKKGYLENEEGKYAPTINGIEAYLMLYSKMFNIEL